MQYGYARLAARAVPTPDASVHGQLALLREAGVPLDHIYIDETADEYLDAAATGDARPGAEIALWTVCRQRPALSDWRSPLL